MGSAGLGTKAMDDLSWDLVRAVGRVVPAPSWPSPTAEMLAGKRFVPGEVPWGTSSAGVGQQLFKGMHRFASSTQHLLGAKRLAAPWSTPAAVPCWLDLGTLSGGRCLGIWLLQQSWGDGQPPWESSHCGGAAPQRDSSAAIAVPLPYASTWQRQESGPKHLFSFTLLLCPS